MRSRPVRLVRAVAIGIAALLAFGAAPIATAAPKASFDTSRASMLTPVLPGVTTDPIISVGDTIGKYMFEAIPDGIALQVREKGKRPAVDVWVNHETSLVPFPYNPSAPTEANSQNDFVNSLLSELVINPQTARIERAGLAIRSKENFQRFCSNFLATAEHGFKRPTLFTNEEAVDWVNRNGQSWPATEGDRKARQSGVVVALDVKSGKRRPIWGMGRHNHENSVAIPGYDEVVVLSGDDTFSNNPSQSQLYSYIADDGKDVWKDRGALWAFVSDNPSFQRYEDFVPGSAVSVTGHFIEVPRLIATGRHKNGRDVMSSDPEVVAILGGNFPPPSDGSWNRPPGQTSGPGVDGPQWVLEKWSQLNGVFRFVRLEDIAYDKRPGMSNIVYVVDSGRGTLGDSQAGRSTNGRVWKLVLDPADPRQVDSLSILIEGDDAPTRTLNEVHQPDNIETTANALYLTEDPGSSQQFPVTSTDPNATTARIWQYKFASPTSTAGTLAVALKVDQSQDEEVGYDVDSAPAGNLGAWESSGIVDASDAFGPGAFLVTVQAHTLWVAKAPGDDNVAPAGPDFTFKREGGQLLLVRIPGG